MPDRTPEWLEAIERLDKNLFIKINSGLANPVFDAVLPFLRDSNFWAPLYLLIGVFMLLNFQKKGLIWIFAFLCAVAITDLVGTYLFKVNVQRLRPCYDPYFFHHVRLLLKQCSGGYSFISNHAANHFGLAAFIVFTLSGWRPYMYFFFLWAFVIAFAQVYVGVHYPGDVLAGALVGIAAGSAVALLFHKVSGKLSLEH